MTPAPINPTPVRTSLDDALYDPAERVRVCGQIAETYRRQGDDCGAKRYQGERAHADGLATQITVEADRQSDASRGQQPQYPIDIRQRSTPSSTAAGRASARTLWLVNRTITNGAGLPFRNRRPGLSRAASASINRRERPPPRARPLVAALALVSGFRRLYPFPRARLQASEPKGYWQLYEFIAALDLTFLRRTRCSAGRVFVLT